MKIIKRILTGLISLAFSAGMFYCFQAGTPVQDGGISVYTVISGLFSLLAPAALTVSFVYIRYLQDKLEEVTRG